MHGGFTYPINYEYYFYTSHSGWWFGTCFIFPSYIYMGCHPSHWLIFFKMVIAPSTRHPLFIFCSLWTGYGFLSSWNRPRPSRSPWRFRGVEVSIEADNSDFRPFLGDHEGMRGRHQWGFPSMGLAPVIIHWWNCPLFFNQPAIGVARDFGNLQLFGIGWCHHVSWVRYHDILSGWSTMNL